MLWAAWGVNRADGHRTAPTAKNTQNAQVYAVLPDGVSGFTTLKITHSFKF